MAKRTLIDILATLSDDELKTAVTEARAKRSRANLDGLVFDDGDEPDTGDGGKGGGKGGGFFGS